MVSVLVNGGGAGAAARHVYHAPVVDVELRARCGTLDCTAGRRKFPGAPDIPDVTVSISPSQESGHSPGIGKADNVLGALVMALGRV